MAEDARHREAFTNKPAENFVELSIHNSSVPPQIRNVRSVRRSRSDTALAFSPSEKESSGIRDIRWTVRKSTLHNWVQRTKVSGGTMLLETAAPARVENRARPCRRPWHCWWSSPSGSQKGVSLSAAATRTGLHVATAHRLLSALVDENFLNFDPYTKRVLPRADALRDRQPGRPRSRVPAATQDASPVTGGGPADARRSRQPVGAVTGREALCIDVIEGRAPVLVEHP